MQFTAHAEKAADRNFNIARLTATLFDKHTFDSANFIAIRPVDRRSFDTIAADQSAASNIFIRHSESSSFCNR